MIQECSGSHPLAGYLNKVVREVNASKLTSVVGGRFQRGPNGTQLIVDAAGGGPPGESATVKMFKIQSSGHGDNHIQCKEWNGTSEVGSSLPIAKPTLLREGVKPTSHDSAHTITLPYSTGDILFAIEPADGTGVSGVTWIDLNVDARMWGYELKFCDTGVAYKATFLCGTVSTV